MSAFGIESGRNINPEEEPRESIGVALLILGLDTSNPDLDLLTTPKIWAIKEKITKPTTLKRSGQISIPAETGKQTQLGRERAEDTTLAAIAEFSGDDSVVDKLFVAGYIKKGISVNGNPADIVVMVYDGPMEKEHSPLDPNETQAYGWVDPDFIRRMNGEVRPLAHDVLTVVNNEAMTQFAQAHLNTENRVPLRSVVGENFSLTGFNQAREFTPDVKFN